MGNIVLVQAKRHQSQENGEIKSKRKVSALRGKEKNPSKQAAFDLTTKSAQVQNGFRKKPL